MRAGNIEFVHHDDESIVIVLPTGERIVVRELRQAGEAQVSLILTDGNKITTTTVDQTFSESGPRATWKRKR